MAQMFQTLMRSQPEPSLTICFVSLSRNFSIPIEYLLIELAPRKRNVLLAFY